jgi:hypothetical protein
LEAGPEVTAAASAGKLRRLRDPLRRGALDGPDSMWNQPYLETCCRSALHRLVLAGPAGRPPALKDGPCLVRLAGMGLAAERADGRFGITDAGVARHQAEVAKPTAAG